MYAGASATGVTASLVGPIDFIVSYYLLSVKELDAKCLRLIVFLWYDNLMDDYDLDQDYEGEPLMNDYNLSYDQGYEDAMFGEDEKATTNADYQSGYIDGLRAREEQEAEDAGVSDACDDDYD